MHILLQFCDKLNNISTSTYMCRNGGKMKKIITILLAVMMLLALTACGGKAVDTPAGGKDDEKNMTLTQSGTGELKLKDFIESPKNC